MKNKFFKKALSVFTAMAMALSLMTGIPFSELGLGITVSAETTTYDVNAKTIAGLGTSVIVDPTAPANDTDAWKGSYVYYGNYDADGDGTAEPVKYRVLDASTTKFGGTTMLLDCDSILYYTPFDSDGTANESGKKANDWSISDVKSSLNGDGFLNKAGVFTTAEKNAIAASNVASHALTTDRATGINVASWTQSTFVNYVALTGEQIFLLDAEDGSNGAYGYSMTDARCENRKKTGSSAAYWWLRSAISSSDLDAGCVSVDGLFSLSVEDSNPGVSPALNLNLSSILFSSVISGTAGETGAEYKLTLLDGDMTIAASGDVTRNGKTVTVPYSISGTNSANATQVSVLILDKEYTAGNTNGATVLDYQKLNVDSFSTTGTGSFTLPDSLSGKKAGTDYHIYIVAEDVNEEKETDYSSEPVKVEKIYLDISEATAVQNGTLTYDGTAQTPTFTVTLGNTTLTADDYDVTVTAQTNAGNYTATIIGKGNYTGTISNVNWSIGKATPSVTAPTANTGLVYTGTAQALIAAGSTDIGTLLYSLDNTNYSEDIPTATKADSYTVYYKVQGNDNVSDVDAKTVSASIGKADPVGDIHRNINVVRGVGTFTEPVFTGVDGQPLGGGVKYGECDYDQLVEYLKTLSSSGVFCRYEFTPNDWKNYNNVTGDISFYIYDVVFKVGNDDATAENAVTVKANPTYGDDWEDILTLNNGLKAVLFNSLNNALDDSEVTTGFSLDVTGSPNAGSQTYNVLFNGTVGGKTYTDHVVATGTVDVAKKELTVSAGDFKVSKVYDGTTNAGASTGELEISGLVGTDTVTITPTIGAYSSADVGTSNVTVTISLTDDSGNYTLGNTTVSVPAEITAKAITPTVEGSGTHTYTGSAITPNVTVKDGETVLEEDKDYTITVTNNINAGIATVTITAKTGGNYTFSERTLDFQIFKATPNVTAPTAKTGLVYNGTAKELISAGSTNFGTLLYSLDDTIYSEDIPTATDAGSYTVYYKVQGNSNVNDSAAQTVSASIGKASVTVTAKNYTVKFGNPLPESLEYETDGLIGTDTLSSIGANVTIGYENAVTPSAIGNYIIVVSGAANTTNYELTYENGKLTIIEKPAQTITAADIELSYGDTGKKIGAATSGDGAISYAVASGDDVIRVATDGTITALKAGTATVEITAAETFDYAKATKTVTVTVNKKKVAVPTADSTEYTYNGKAQTYGVVSTDDYTVTGGTQTDAGNYPITITLNNENFEWDGVLGTYTFIIKKAAVTITANSYTVKVGNTLPKFDYKVSGLVNNEALPITVTVSCTAADSKTAGEYPITVSGAADSTNYTFNYVDGTLTITLKDIQTITAADVTLTYGDAGKKIGATTNGDGAITYAVASGDDVISVAEDGTITALKAGTATVEITAAETDGYAAATKTVSVTVNKKKVAVPTADSTEYTYNGKAQTYGVVSTADYTVTGGTQTNAGNYPITITLNDENFEWDGVLGTHTFVIKQAAVTITANSYTVNVGKALPTFDYKVTGLVNNEKLPITVTVSCTAADSKTEGTYPITVSGADKSANYTFNYVNGTLKITSKETQTITADDVTLTYGDAGKKIGATTNGDGAISYAVKTGNDVITVAADGTIKALKSGTATVEITAAETDAYEQATTTVTVTVNKSAVTIKADDKTVYQNAALPTFTYSVTGLANGDKLSFTPVLTCEATTTSTVGTYAITVTIEITEDECYTYTTTNGTLTVKKKSSGGGGGGGYRPTTPTEPNNPSIGGSAKSWSDVAADLGKLTNGSETTIELNGNTTLPTPVIKAIADKDSKVTFVINSVFSWVVDGAEITTPVAIDLTLIKTASTKSDTLRGIEGTQFKINGTNIPTDLMIAFKKEHEGKFANLYKVVDGKLVFVTCAKLGEDGKVILPDVVEKGDYVAMLCEFSDRLGDMDNDGVMNAKDAAAILKDIVEIEPGKNPLMADFNGDGKVNAMDAAAILKRIVGLA